MERKRKEEESLRVSCTEVCAAACPTCKERCMKECHIAKKGGSGSCKQIAAGCCHECKDDCMTICDLCAKS